MAPAQWPRPPAGKREEKRWGGDYRRKTQANWDFFDALSEDEQRRLYERWFAPAGHGMSPDEVEERMPIDEWLRLTRQADLGRAMATGKGTNSRRFGGLRPSSLVAGEPYDFATLHSADDGKAALHIQRARAAGRFGVSEGNKCQFRTNPKTGEVYPLANTCTQGAYVTSEPARDYSDLDAQGAF